MLYPYIGLTITREVTAYEVKIEGRGGDSVHEEVFETEEGAIRAGGGNNKPKPVKLLKLSDGTYIKPPQVVHVSGAPSVEQIEGFKNNNLSPGVRILLAQKARRS